MATLSRFKAAHRLSAAPGVPSMRSRSGTAAVEELVLPVFELPLLVVGAPCTADGVTRAALDWRAHTASSSTAALHMRMPTALPVSRRRPATGPPPPPDERRSSAQATSSEITPSLHEDALQSNDTPSLPPTSLLLPPVTHQHVSETRRPCPRLAFLLPIQKFCSVAQQLTTR